MGLGGAVINYYFAFLFHLFYIRSRLICTVVRLFMLLRRRKSGRKIRFFLLGARGRGFTVSGLKHVLEGPIWPVYVAFYFYLCVCVCVYIYIYIRELSICTILLSLYL